MRMNQPFISFVIPVFNEAENIGRMLRNLHNVLREHEHWSWEVIIVEDGSSDNTLEVLKHEITQYEQTRLIVHEGNKGYTQSLKDGLKEARGEFLMYIGADEEFDSSELPLFVEPLLQRKADLVLGVRWQRNAYGLFRFFLSVIYIFFLNGLFKLRVNDYNWSQAWSRKLLEEIALDSKSLFVLPEIIIKAFDLDYKVLEVPSNHRGRQAGKSSLNMKIMGHALWEAIKFALRRKSKDYQAKAFFPKEGFL